MVATRNLHSTQDDDLDVDQTAQSIQDQLQQYKLTTFDATRFAGFTNDNDSVLNHVQKGYQQAADIAIDLEQLGESEEAQKLLESVTICIDAEHELATQKMIFQQLANRIQRGEAINDPVAAYNQFLQREQAKYRAMSAKKKYYTNRKFEDFRQAIWDVNHGSDEPMPPYVAPGQVETADDDDDDDLLVSQGRRSMKCPLTGTWLEDPVTSKLCGHSFSRDAIMSLIRSRRGRAECPMTGCHKVLDQSALYDDTMLERSVERAMEEERLRTEQTEFFDVE